jgi:hypothetical protein
MLNSVGKNKNSNIWSLLELINISLCFHEYHSSFERLSHSMALKFCLNRIEIWSKDSFYFLCRLIISSFNVERNWINRGEIKSKPAMIRIASTSFKIMMNSRTKQFILIIMSIILETIIARINFGSYFISLKRIKVRLVSTIMFFGFSNYRNLKFCKTCNRLNKNCF